MSSKMNGSTADELFPGRKQSLPDGFLNLVKTAPKTTIDYPFAKASAQNCPTRNCAGDRPHPTEVGRTLQTLTKSSPLPIIKLLPAALRLLFRLFFPILIFPILCALSTRSFYNEVYNPYLVPWLGLCKFGLCEAKIEVPEGVEMIEEDDDDDGILKLMTTVFH
jgi:hypothetical protein